MSAPYIVAIGGTLRANSSTERAMRFVLDATQRAGARTKLISGSSLQLPLYQPDNPERSDGARDLVAELALADGIILGSPGYHGSISGLVRMHWIMRKTCVRMCGLTSAAAPWVASLRPPDGLVR